MAADTNTATTMTCTVVDRFAAGRGAELAELFTPDGVPHAAHHGHVLNAGPDGLIVRDQVWCGGRYDAALLAEMGAVDDAG